VHNDSLNIWTHLLGAIWIIYLMYETVCTDTFSSLFWDKMVVLAYLALAGYCFLSSAVYHTFRSHSISVMISTLIMDILGITSHIFGSTVLLVFYELSCFPHWQRAYLAAMCILAAATALYTPHLVRMRKTNVRTLILFVFGTTGIVAWLHHFILIGGVWNRFNSHSLVGILTTYGWILLGLVIRRVHLPERLFPGKFDILFSSHQLFHLTTIASALALLSGYKQLHHWQITHLCDHASPLLLFPQPTNLP